MKLQEAYLSLMVSVLKANGEVHDTEVDLLAQMMDQVGMDEDVSSRILGLTQTTTVPPASAFSVPPSMSASEVLWFVRDALMMAAADSEVEECEIQVIRDFLSHLRLDSGRTERIIEWAKDELLHHRKGLSLIEASG